MFWRMFFSNKEHKFYLELAIFHWILSSFSFLRVLTFHAGVKTISRKNYFLYFLWASEKHLSSNPTCMIAKYSYLYRTYDLQNFCCIVAWVGMHSRILIRCCKSFCFLSQKTNCANPMLPLLHNYKNFVFRFSWTLKISPPFFLILSGHL